MLGYSEEYKYIVKIKNNSSHTSKMEQHADVLKVFRYFGMESRKEEGHLDLSHVM